ncbi:hypothetical protein CORMATOL_02562 [Corynebacterium matruchotii ATCC 33806]|uniref:Uncharacterized protein n=1 Tax=Corynebacterium matruchotii ATCC 33806 TaxID=566549 RepID=C0E6C9_9CORY|nr:hypothetical protein CORMATOL_02562 [Corynebacterium matruchotii ATCC 33806]
MENLAGDLGFCVHYRHAGPVENYSNTIARRCRAVRYGPVFGLPTASTSV